MLVIAFFVLFAGILDAVAIGICTFIERYSEYVSLLAFLAFFIGNFIVAWYVAVFVIERYFVSEGQRKKNEEHVKWVNSLAVRR